MPMYYYLKRSTFAASRIMTFTCLNFPSSLEGTQKTSAKLYFNCTSLQTMLERLQWGVDHLIISTYEPVELFCD